MASAKKKTQTSPNRKLAAPSRQAEETRNRKTAEVKPAARAKPAQSKPTAPTESSKSGKVKPPGATETNRALTPKLAPLTSEEKRAMVIVRKAAIPGDMNALRQIDPRVLQSLIDKKRLVFPEVLPTRGKGGLASSKDWLAAVKKVREEREKQAKSQS